MELKLRKGEVKIGLLDLGGNENKLSYQGKELFEVLKMYASFKNYPFDLTVFGAGIEYGQGFCVEDKGYVESDDYEVMEEKIYKALDRSFKNIDFIVSTVIGFSLEFDTIAEWCRLNNKIYFITMLDEDIPILNEDKNKYSNVILFPSPCIPYEVELLAMDCYSMINYGKNIQTIEISKHLKIENNSKENFIIISNDQLYQYELKIIF